MMNSPIIERFAEESPTSLMVQGLMEHLFAQQELDALFEQQAQAQYTRDLLFSEVVDLMSLVVCGLQPSVNRAYQRKAKDLQVSRTAVYDKLNRMEPEVSAALVRYSSEQLSSCIREMGRSPTGVGRGTPSADSGRQLFSGHRPSFSGVATLCG
jgi:hypothetical protein